MKRRAAILIGTTLFVVAFVSPSFAQQPAPEGVVIRQERVFQGPDGGPPPPLGNNVLFVSTENFGGKVVKGAPYSADAVTESIQTLPDGNRIVNKNTSRQFRDSDGRTRREETLKALSGVGTSEEPLQTIFINDPVAGVTYALDSHTHIALKSVPFRLELNKPGTWTTGEAGQKFEFRVGPESAGTSGVIVTAPAPPPGAQGGLPPNEQRQVTLRATEGVAMNYIYKRVGSEANAVKENLGKQNIEGVEAEGTRTTITIAAGEIGNERPIEIVSERWYSPELQLVVMTRHSDPRSGETTYKLTNINRAEPAKSLFEVPAGFSVKEMQMGPPAMAPLPRKRPE